MATRKRRLTDADKKALARVQELWTDYKKKNPGVSQETAAARAGMTQSAFSQFILGRVAMRVSPILKLAKLFGVAPTAIREDLAELAYSLPTQRSNRPKISEPGIRDPSPEGMEIAHVFDALSPQSQEFFRSLLFTQAAIDKRFPWLRLGRPISRTYDQFEKWHQDNIQTMVTLEAQRQAKK